MSHPLLDSLREKITKIPILKKYADVIESSTKVNIEYFVIVILVILALCIFSGFLASPIVNLIGFLYPAYASIVALESTHTKDDTQWLTYWVVFSYFHVVENFTDYILFWVPFYYAVKCAFLLWCMLPQYNGATVVYNSLIKPVFLKHESAIDEALNALDPLSAKKDN